MVVVTARIAGWPDKIFKTGCLLPVALALIFFLFTKSDFVF